MAGISTSGAGTTPHLPTSEPPASEGHRGGADNDNNTISAALLDQLQRFPGISSSDANAAPLALPLGPTSSEEGIGGGIDHGASDDG